MIENSSYIFENYIHNCFIIIYIILKFNAYCACFKEPPRCDIIRYWKVVGGRDFFAVESLLGQKINTIMNESENGLSGAADDAGLGDQLLFLKVRWNETIYIYALDDQRFCCWHWNVVFGFVRFIIWCIYCLSCFCMFYASEFSWNPRGEKLKRNDRS